MAFLVVKMARRISALRFVVPERQALPRAALPLPSKLDGGLFRRRG